MTEQGFLKKQLQVATDGRIGLDFSYNRGGWVVGNVTQDPPQDLVLGDTIVEINGHTLLAKSTADQIDLFRNHLRCGVSIGILRQAPKIQVTSSAPCLHISPSPPQQLPPSPDYKLQPKLQASYEEPRMMSKKPSTNDATVTTATHHRRSYRASEQQEHATRKTKSARRRKVVIPKAMSDALQSSSSQKGRGFGHSYEEKPKAPTPKKTRERRRRRMLATFSGTLPKEQVARFVKCVAKLPKDRVAHFVACVKKFDKNQTRKPSSRSRRKEKVMKRKRTVSISPKKSAFSPAATVTLSGGKRARAKRRRVTSPEYTRRRRVSTVDLTSPSPNFTANSPNEEVLDFVDNTSSSQRDRAGPAKAVRHIRRVYRPLKSVSKEPSEDPFVVRERDPDVTFPVISPPFTPARLPLSPSEAWDILANKVNSPSPSDLRNWAEASPSPERWRPETSSSHSEPTEDRQIEEEQFYYPLSPPHHWTRVVQGPSRKSTPSSNLPTPTGGHGCGRPSTVADWSKDHVADWVYGLGAAYHDYAQEILDNGVCGVMLGTLNDEMMIELGIRKRLHRCRIRLGIQELFAQEVFCLKQ